MARTTDIRVRDLPRRPAPGVALYCARCGESFSATRGDYFLAGDDTVMVHCGRSMQLARRRTVWTVVTPEQADNVG